MSNTRVTAGRYTRVGSKKGPLVIGGAEKKMAEDPTFTYVPLFRVAGPRDDVEQWLNENHPTRSKEAMKGCYNTTTLKSKSVRDAYEKELEHANEARATVSNTKAEMRQVNLMVLVRLLKIYDEQKRNGVDENAVTSTKSVNDLKEKVKSLPGEGKVLDVTNMKAKGADSKKMVMKDNSNKRRLSQQESDPFYHVVYNPKSKNSVTGVKNFLKAHGGFETDRISKISEAVAEGSVINISRGKSPTRSPMLSPSRRGKDRKARREDVEDILDEL
jgi:hypothetical protein